MQSQHTASELKEQGKIFFKEQQFSKAIECYNTALSQSGVESDLLAALHSNLSICYSKLGDFPNALKEADLSIAASSTLKAHQLRAAAFSALGRERDAISTLKQLLQVEPSLIKTPSNFRPLFFDLPFGVQYNYPGDLSTYSIFSSCIDPEREALRDGLFNGSDLFQKDPAFDAAMGSFLGMVIGDAIGAPFEFSSVRYGVQEMKQGFTESHLWKQGSYNTFCLKPGQWTDDASMGLCLSDSLIIHDHWNPLDLRLRFLHWWKNGYCNAFGYDDTRGSKGSVGLGGNISMSMGEFQREQKEYTSAGDRNTSGNGSVMRNAAVPVCFWRDPKKGMEIGYLQSKTTHQGEEAADCCRLLSFIIMKAIQKRSKGEPISVREFLDDLSEFTSPLYSVTCLAQGKAEEKHSENASLNINDRKWNWKETDFQYSKTRAKQQPGYIGSYCMDALSMALHCVYRSNSFKEALLLCSNMRGDADSVASVCGQIAGSVWGVSTIDKNWIETILIWDPFYTIPLRAKRLFFKLAEAKEQ